jgi:hypothetical protein
VARCQSRLQRWAKVIWKLSSKIFADKAGVGV